MAGQVPAPSVLQGGMCKACKVSLRKEQEPVSLKKSWRQPTCIFAVESAEMQDPGSIPFDSVI